ncbi:porin [Acidovorax sp.]|uniref:porin n=1 Tax=Acidovorax sp. TaxID=1872122 RepID=UPI0026249784|nr:porin [Acidovorax sp.]
MTKRTGFFIILAMGVLMLSGAATAQDGTVIYGKLYTQFTHANTSGATPTGTAVSTLGASPTGVNFSKNELASSDSWMGFRGNESLGGGLKAFWQIEGNVAVDSGSSEFANRNTHIGLSGSIGTLRLGNIDTPYKRAGDTLSFLGVSARNHVTNVGLMTRMGSGNSLSSSFHLRSPNSIVYESPTLGGLQLMAQYAPDEVKAATRNAYLQSYAATYTFNDLYLALGHEIHLDRFGGSLNSPGSRSNFANAAANSRDYSTRVTAKYRLENTTIEFDYAWNNYRESGGAVNKFESYKNRAWLIALQHKVGLITFAAAYVSAKQGTCSLVGGAFCSTDGLEAAQLNLGASYALSKRTYVYLISSRLKNGKSAVFSNLSTGAAPPGADITQVSLGVSHSF